MSSFRSHLYVHVFTPVRQFVFEFRSLPKTNRRARSTTWDSFNGKVLDENFIFDDLENKKQTNFSDGLCYDAKLRQLRRIVPEDGATLSTGYPLPLFDQIKWKKLDAFLAEMLPNKAVRDFDVSERCLNMQQANAKFYLSNGRGGAGKGLKCELTKAAFGCDYSLEMDKGMLKSNLFENPEGPKSMRNQMRNKVYICSQELARVDPTTVNQWTGGNDIQARGMRENSTPFKPLFTMLKMNYIFAWWSLWRRRHIGLVWFSFRRRTVAVVKPRIQGGEDASGTGTARPRQQTSSRLPPCNTQRLSVLQRFNTNPRLVIAALTSDRHVNLESACPGG